MNVEHLMFLHLQMRKTPRFPPIQPKSYKDSIKDLNDLKI